MVVLVKSRNQNNIKNLKEYDFLANSECFLCTDIQNKLLNLLKIENWYEETVGIGNIK